MATESLKIAQERMLPCIEAVCSGDPREMGRMQGEVLRPKITQGSQILRRLEAFELQRPWWMPRSVYIKLARRASTRFLREALNRQSPGNLDRLLGIAEGAQMPPDMLFLMNAMEAVLSDLSKSAHVPASAACSAMAVTGPASESGHALVAHNFDYLPIVQPLYTMRDCRPEGGYRSLEFTAAPLSGTVSGINEAGLAITYNYAYTTDRTGAAPTISMRISEALAACETVEQATDRLSSTSRWGSGLLMLADAEDRIASLELSTTRAEVRTAGAEGWLAHTNHCQTDHLREVELPLEARYSDRAPEALRERRVHQSSERRDARFEQLMSGTVDHTAESVHRIMCDHGADEDGGGDTICMHGNYWNTTASLQLDPHARALRIDYSSACEAEFHEFTFDD